MGKAAVNSLIPLPFPLVVEDESRQQSLTVRRDRRRSRRRGGSVTFRSSSIGAAAARTQRHPDEHHRCDSEPLHHSKRRHLRWRYSLNLQTPAVTRNVAVRPCVDRNISRKTIPDGLMTKSWTSVSPVLALV